MNQWRMVCSRYGAPGDADRRGKASPLVSCFRPWVCMKSVHSATEVQEELLFILRRNKSRYVVVRHAIALPTHGQICFFTCSSGWTQEQNASNITYEV